MRHDSRPPSQPLKTDTVRHGLLIQIWANHSMVNKSLHVSPSVWCQQRLEESSTQHQKPLAIEDETRTIQASKHLTPSASSLFRKDYWRYLPCHDCTGQSKMMMLRGSNFNYPRTIAQAACLAWELWSQIMWLLTLYCLISVPSCLWQRVWFIRSHLLSPVLHHCDVTSVRCTPCPSHLCFQKRTSLPATKLLPPLGLQRPLLLFHLVPDPTSRLVLHQASLHVPRNELYLQAMFTM